MSRAGRDDDQCRNHLSVGFLNADVYQFIKPFQSQEFFRGIAQKVLYCLGFCLQLSNQACTL
jgi:hypothetical protein